MQELRLQLQTEKARGEEMWEELGDTEQTLTEVRAEKSDLQKTCDELRSENSELKKQLAAALTENPEPEQKSVAAGELPDAADLLNQLKAKMKAERKKSTASLADVEKILEILGGGDEN